MGLTKDGRPSGKRGRGLGLGAGVGRGRGFGAASIESFLLETFRLAETVDREDVASRESRFSLICASMAALTAAVGESGMLRGEKGPAPTAAIRSSEPKGVDRFVAFAYKGCDR